MCVMCLNSKRGRPCHGMMLPSLKAWTAPATTGRREAGRPFTHGGGITADPSGVPMSWEASPHKPPARGGSTGRVVAVTRRQAWRNWRMA
eukprot:361463-Chlamydomonas_euryale.AAC.1